MKHKPSQAPVYRLTERLLSWAMPVAARLPKSLPFQVLGGRFVSNINDCLDIIATAYTLDRNSPTYEARKKDCYGCLILRLTSLKTLMRVFVRQRYANPKGELVPVVSPKQEGAFIDLINQIGIQIEAWLGR